ncbi:hypothetical protein SAMN04488052_1233 [Aquisalimonas asiatica]|uniref:Transmembrane protein n=1 Tax=Aquisalimonas asiatica TaxID=406100 RepID=A0A1H8VXR6_9GAMM|nr:hypothetical protein SAMN04488052_1233 [Aquisalimonas asiatica]
MFDFGQLPTWLRRATWGWRLVRHVRSKKSLCKSASKLPSLDLADRERESFGSHGGRADDKRVEFLYRNDSFLASFFVIVFSVFVILGVYIFIFPTYEVLHNNIFHERVVLYQSFFMLLLFLFFLFSLFLVFTRFFFLLSLCVTSSSGFSVNDATMS